MSTKDFQENLHSYYVRNIRLMMLSFLDDLDNIFDWLNAGKTVTFSWDDFGNEKAPLIQ